MRFEENWPRGFVEDCLKMWMEGWTDDGWGVITIAHPGSLSINLIKGR